MKPFLQIVGVALVAGLVAGALVAHFAPPGPAGAPGKDGFGTSNSAGTTFNSAKVAMINWAPTSASATTTSVYNGDSADRTIENFTYFCSGLTTMNGTGAGLAALVFSAATGSTQTPVAITNTNFVYNSTVGTSSLGLSYDATTSPGVTGGHLGVATSTRIWPTHTYINITSNGTSSAAACTIGVHYFGT